MRPIIASDLMNPEVLSVRPELNLDGLAAFLIDNQISGAPVIDRNGTPVGVVSLVDITNARHEDRRTTRVRDVMTPSVFSVREDATVSEIATTLLHHHLHRVLVLRDGEVVGLISTSDLLGLLVDAE